MQETEAVWRQRSVPRHLQSPEAPAFFCVVEPGTATLRLLVVEVDDNRATIWGWDERPGWGTISADVQWLTDACEKALTQAEQMAQDLSERWILPDQILVGLPASQLRGRAWSVTQHRSRPERPVDEQELETLLARALRLAANRLQSAEHIGSEWLVLDAAPVSLTVDGRGVTDPVGFRGREIGAMVFAALAHVDVIHAWGLVARELEFSALTLTAAPLALAGLSGAQGMLVDVGGETTDFVWCQAGRPVALDSRPIGGSALTRALTRKWRLSSDRAECLKQAYTDGKLADKAHDQVLEVLSPSLCTWTEEVEAAMAHLNQDEPLPQKLYLLGGGSALPEIAKALHSLAWSERLHFARYPQISRLHPTDVPGVVNRTEFGREPGDVSALALAAWVAQQDCSSDRPSRILAEICHQ
jgi:cell division protein FtsA